MSRWKGKARETIPTHLEAVEGHLSQEHNTFDVQIVDIDTIVEVCLDEVDQELYEMCQQLLIRSTRFKRKDPRRNAAGSPR